MSILRSPVTQFLVIGFLLIAAISAATVSLAERAAEAEALEEARATNEVLASSVARPDLERGVVEGETTAVDRFDNSVTKRLLVGPVARVNIWSESGRLVYSSIFQLNGQDFELSPDHERVLAEGGTSSQLFDPSSPENVLPEGAAYVGDITDDSELVRIYTRFRSPDRVPLLFEGYYSLSDIEDRREEIFTSFRLITIGGPVLLLLLATPMIVVLTRRLTRGSKEREKLLHSAIDASDAERRRIARDLHDSVVQDLAGTAFSISAVARDEATPEESRGHLREAGSSLRDSLKALRSLLAEIHPPELQAEGLAAALADLTAPAAAADVTATVRVEGAETASDERGALVWRVAQEAVRNALRHSGASTLAVTVIGDGRHLVLEVVDDGAGFDATQRSDPNSFGLRGLRSLVAESGGTLEVTSSPGRGTSVRMEVEAR